MHNPADRVRLHEAANYIVESYNSQKSPQQQVHGFLQVCDATKPGELILVTRLGNFNRLNFMTYPSEVLTLRISTLVNYYQNGQLIPKGFTSGDLGPQTHSGAVIVDDLVFSLASQHSFEEAMLDEAFTLMIAIKAGLLQRKSVRSMRAMPDRIRFNPHLSRLMNTITWTD